MNRILALARSGFVSALCLIATACGGGGDVASTPPSPAPPSPPIYDSFVGLNKNVDLPTTSAATSYTDTGTVRNSVSRDTKGAFGDGNVVIAYNATSQSYTIRDGVRSTSFLPADKDATPSLGNGQFDTFSRNDSSGNLVDYLALYRSGSANTASVQLSYLKFAVSFHRDISNASSGNATIANRLVLAIGGFQTLASDMPSTGQASYATFLYAVGIGSDTNRAVTGDAQLTANFASGSVATSLALRDSASQSIGDFSGTAPFDSSGIHFAGNLTNNMGTQGTFSGGFFGPQAAEAGYTFRVQTTLGTVDGGVVGRKN